MKREDQVCTLEQAQKLQDLGIVHNDYQFAFVDFGVPSGQESVLCRPATDSEQYHDNLSWYCVGKYSNEIRVELDEGSLSADGGVYPAFTVSELGVMLPEEIGVQRKDGKWQVMANKLLYPFPHIQEGHNWLIVYSDYSEAEAKAQMLIMLLENNLTTPEEVNQRLSN